MEKNHKDREKREKHPLQKKSIYDQPIQENVNEEYGCSLDALVDPKGKQKKTQKEKQNNQGENREK